MSGRLSASTAAYDVVSFDVFDTLVSRAIEAPTDVFRVVRAKLLSTSCALFFPTAIDSLPDLRVQAERLARIEVERCTGSDEVTLDDIYTNFARISGVNGETLALLRRTELETEMELAYANPDGAALLDGARAAGKRILLCSDMYLPTPTIRAILQSCGYGENDPLFVSGELGVSKHRGTMFGYISQAIGVAPGRILHIGDNLHGDVVMAQSAGWLARHLPNPSPSPRPPTPWSNDDREAEAVTTIVSGLVRKRERLSGAIPCDPLH